MNYKSTIQIESTEVPGVTFTLRKMSHGRRLQLNEAAATVMTEINAIQQQITPLMAEVAKAEEIGLTEPCSCQDHEHKPAEGKPQLCSVSGCRCRCGYVDPEVLDQIDKLTTDHFELMVTKMFPIYLRWGVAEIHGLDIDDKPATVESLLDSGLEHLVSEIGWKIHSVINLTKAELVGFKQPTISGVVVDGQMKGTTAPRAGETPSILNEDA